MTDPLDLLNKREASLVRRWKGSSWYEPALATLTNQRFSDPGWLFERKLDGVRTIAGRVDQVTLWSRSHLSMNQMYPELVEAFDRTGPERFVVDGEIVAFEGRQTSFARLRPRISLTNRQQIERTGIAVFCTSSICWRWEMPTSPSFPLRTRKRLLRTAVNFAHPLRYSTRRNRDGEAYYRHACANGWEGLIAKRADVAYHGGRSKRWPKFNCAADQEFVIGGSPNRRGHDTGSARCWSATTTARTFATPARSTPDTTSRRCGRSVTG